MVGWILVIILIVLMLFFVGALLFEPIINFKEKKFHKKSVYRVLNYFASEQDHLLLNDLTLFLDVNDKEPTNIEHLLLADKYIYVISTFYGKGGLYGNLKDETLFLKLNDKKSVKVDNPVLKNKTIIEKLSNNINVTSSDKILFSIVVYNSSLIIPSGLIESVQNSCFIPLKLLEKTLKDAEKDNVANISHESSEKLALTLKKKSENCKKELDDYQNRMKKVRR